MSFIFRKVLNLKNACHFKLLLHFTRQEGNVGFLNKPSLLTAVVSRNMTTFSGDATKVSMPSAIVEFLHFVQKEDADRILVELQGMKKGFIRKIPLKEMTGIVDLLIKKKKAFDLSCCIQAMSYIIDNDNEVLKPLLEKYSNAGDIGYLNEIAKVFPDFVLIKCCFNIYLTKAYISSGKYEDLFLQLEKHRNFKNKLITPLAFDKLLKRPEFEERVINLAKKYLECKMDFPMALVWAHYLTNNNFEKANELFNMYTIPADKVDLIVLKAISQQENVKMGQLYISALNNQNVRSRYKERAYGTLLNVLVSTGKYDDAISLISNAMENDVDMETHYRSTLIKLKNALEAEKKEVPFSISS